MKILILIALSCVSHSIWSAEANNVYNELEVVGRNFTIPATQQIEFVTLKPIDPELFNDKRLPRVIDLIPYQTKVKYQGQRGSCTYFVIGSLIESLLKKSLNRDVDVSEEYIIWASKVKKGMRSHEEGSSVAVNAATVQEFGIMLEQDLPYEPSWFEKGFPCEVQENMSNIDPICFSHKGPSLENSKYVINGENFYFETINSRSIDLVRALARFRNPVAVSILANYKKTWAQPSETGELVLTAKLKKECQNNPKLCSGHSVLVVGYDIDKRLFIFKNSWGDDWGVGGYGTISFDYIDQMSDRKFLVGYLNGNIKIPKKNQH
jgi:C1A family cysteine protease